MFSLPRLLLLAFLAAPAALAAGTPSPVPVAPTRVRRYAPVEDASSVFNPTGIVPRALAHNPAEARGLTNGQRLARGLPPRSPAFNTRRRALAPRQSASPCALSQATGTIRVADTNGAVLGYVSSSANEYGEYSLATDAAGALSVALRRCDSNDSPFDIEALNGLSTYPYLGGVVGFANTDDNLRAGSFNYVYIAGTSQVAHGPAQSAPNAFSAAAGTPKDVESAVWTLSGADALAFNWVNTDGSAAAGTLVYVPSSAAFTYTGDLAAFVATFGPATAVTFTFVDAAAPQ
ncbi:hypothetical protein TRAPUB_8033 [Trametes pubescens]|uniref:Uncharacterized protein n=1 Tax=Trametes pubescens TaxID=154538 RepID=A0A1M2W6B0_TRAPU|nr:hypothetical protein TRAPUB_8033 [Trametes pubescens]